MGKTTRVRYAELNQSGLTEYHKQRALLPVHGRSRVHGVVVTQTRQSCRIATCLAAALDIERRYLNPISGRYDYGYAATADSDLGLITEAVTRGM